MREEVGQSGNVKLSRLTGGPKRPGDEILDEVSLTGEIKCKIRKTCGEVTYETAIAVSVLQRVRLR